MPFFVEKGTFFVPTNYFQFFCIFDSIEFLELLPMSTIQREDIHLIARNSDIPADETHQLLKTHVYTNSLDWKKFLQLFSLSAGTGFVVFGIVFFFAYNWADLHKFVKLGLIAALLLTATTIALLPTVKALIQKIALTFAVAFIGVLFAVYGQIYQTGANAYDFFLAWTIFATLWVVVGNFSPLWLIYLVLLNTSLVLYAEQVAENWSEILVYTLLAVLNALFYIIATRFFKEKTPIWLLHTVGLAIAFCATIGVIIGVFESFKIEFLFILLIAASLFGGGIWYGLTSKSSYLLAIIPFCIIAICSALMFKISNHELMFFAVSLFVIGSVTFTIKNLFNLQKKWAHENN